MVEMADAGKKTIVKSAVLMIVMYILMYFSVYITGMDRISISTISDDRITGTITSKSGQKETGLTREHFNLSYGDTLDADIHLSDKKPYAETNICFYVYNSDIEVSAEGKVLYSYGSKLTAEHRQIGNVLVNIHVPDDLWGKDLHIKLVERELSGTLQNTPYILIPTSFSRMYPIIGNEVKFIIFGVFMVVGVFLCLYGMVIKRKSNSNAFAVNIGLATFLLCCWYYGYNRYFYVFCTNTRFCSMVEYYALHLVSLPIIAYTYKAIQDKRRKHIVLGLGIVQGVFTTVAFTLDGFRITKLSDTLPVQQLLIGVILLVSFWLVLEGTRKDKNGFEASLLIGITLGMIFAVLEIVSIRALALRGFPSKLEGVARIDYASLGLAVLIITLIISTMQRFYQDLRSEAEHDELEKLAYTDLLTGIPNRISVTEKMKTITADEWYAVAFLDVDGLKKANDTYGHDVGDALIKEAAEIIRKTFNEESGFYGRWGGDEFLAIFKDREELKRFKHLFDQRVSEETKNSTLPVPFSISAGYYEHEDGAEESVNDSINNADDAMYQIKKAKKAARND